MKRSLAVLVVLVVVVAGCGSHHGAAPFVPATGTLPPSTAAPSTTVAQAPVSPTTTIDTSRVPGRITVAYVDAVLKVLEQVEGNGTRAAVRVHNFTITTERDFAAVFSPTFRNSEILSLLQSIQKYYSAFRQPPGDLIVAVQRIVSAEPSCIYARVRTSYRLLARGRTAPVNAEFMELDRAPNRRFISLNPTGWVIGFDRVTVTPAPIPDQCTT